MAKKQPAVCFLMPKCFMYGTCVEFYHNFIIKLSHICIPGPSKGCQMVPLQDVNSPSLWGLIGTRWKVLVGKYYAIHGAFGIRKLSWG